MTRIASTPRPKGETRPPAPTIADFGNQRIVLRGVGKDVYALLDEAIGPGQHVRLACDGEDLELMTTSDLHEFFKVLFGRFVDVISIEFEIDQIAVGEKTWKTKRTDRGLQADLSYYFEPAKITMARKGFRRKSMNPADYPSAPDLAIEIDSSRPQIDRPSIYAALKAFEIWRFDGVDVRIEQLQPDGTYLAVKRSRFLPVTAEQIRRWILDDEASDGQAWVRRLTQWARRLRRRK